MFRQKRAHRVRETTRIIEGDMVIAVGDLGQFNMGTTRLNLGEDLWVDALAQRACDQQCWNADLAPAGEAVSEFALGMYPAVELVLPASVIRLPGTT